jgi:hypothetical protein
LKEASGRNCHLWIYVRVYEVCFGGKSYIIIPKDAEIALRIKIKGDM